MHTIQSARRRRLRSTGLLIFLILVSLLLTACDDGQPTAMPTTQLQENGDLPAEDVDGDEAPVELIADVVAAHNRLGMLVFQQLLPPSDSAHGGNNDSVFISPTSIALALSMAYNGADGKTAEAMAEALQLAELLQGGLSRDALNNANLVLLQALTDGASGDPGASRGTGPADDTDAPQVRLDIASSIWYRRELAFNQAFVQDNARFYRALVTGLDFSTPDSVDTINRWVSDATEGLIPTVIDRLDDDLIMMLINAVYFKGEWTTPFEERRTRDMPFQTVSGDRVTVQMMYRAGRIDYYKGDFQAVRLPYGDDERLAMYVFLPPVDEDFFEFARRFTYDDMAASFGRFAPAEGELYMPRLDISYKSKLNDALKALGMGIAFDGGAADFGRMRPAGETRNVYISDVIHQSVLKVDEKGTEAAAVTSVDFRVTSLPVYDFTFKADRPFIAVIRDDVTEALLFVGAIVHPGGPGSAR